MAGASCCTDPELLANARRYASTQHVLLADLDEERGWLLDLRTAGHIPKHWLSGRSPSQLLPQIAQRVDPFPLSEDHSDVIPLEQLSVADFYDAYRLDFAQVTFGSKSVSGGHAEPAL